MGYSLGYCQHAQRWYSRSRWWSARSCPSCPERYFLFPKTTPEESDRFPTPTQTSSKSDKTGRNIHPFSPVFTPRNWENWTPFWHSWPKSVDPWALHGGISPPVKRVIFPHPTLTIPKVDVRNVWAGGRPTYGLLLGFELKRCLKGG